MAWRQHHGENGIRRDYARYRCQRQRCLSYRRIEHHRHVWRNGMAAAYIAVNNNGIA